MKVTFDQVGVTYPSAPQPALADVSFSVTPGERVALLGSSGAGKTTLLHVAAGLIDPTTGTMSRDGIPYTELGKSHRRGSDARVGMVHQQLNLVSNLRVVHNVNAGALGSWSTRKALRSLWFGAVETHEVRDSLDRLGIADKLHARTADLSGGQQQRVALARVLRQQPDLLLADEPVSSVDPAWSEEVLTVLTQEVNARSAALIVSLHDVELARLHCTRLIGLRNGRVQFDLPTEHVEQAQIAALYTIERLEHRSK